MFPGSLPSQLEFLSTSQHYYEALYWIAEATDQHGCYPIVGAVLATAILSCRLQARHHDNTVLFSLELQTYTQMQTATCNRHSLH